MVRRKLPLIHLLEIQVIGTEISDLTRLFNIWTIGAMDRTLGQSQVKLSLLGSISLKIDNMLWSRDLSLN
jgi:hypothetical protein